MKYKRLIQLSLAVLIASNSLTVFAKSQTITENKANVYVNDKLGAEGFIDKDRTYIPLRNVSELLGAIVDWNGERKEVTISKGHTTIVQEIDSSTAKVNSRIIEIGASAMIKDNTTYVPVRFVSEVLGNQVDWDQETRTVKIKSNDEEVSIPDKPDTDLPEITEVETPDLEETPEVEAPDIKDEPEVEKPVSDNKLQIPDEPRNSLQQKYVDLSKSALEIYKLPSKPITDYAPMSQVPVSFQGSWYETVQEFNLNQLPLQLDNHKWSEIIYDIKKGVVAGDVPVLEITALTTNRNYGPSFTFYTDKDGFMTRRDVFIEDHVETVTNFTIDSSGRQAYVVKYRYHLPRSEFDSITAKDVKGIAINSGSKKATLINIKL